MKFLKNIFSRLTSLVTIFRVYSQVEMALRSFPGLSNEIQLRAWLLENLDILGRLALQTTTKVDDMIVHSMARLIENDTAWKILSRMVHIAEPLIDDHSEQSEVEPSAEICYCSSSLEMIGDSLREEEPVQNPLLILTAVGILLQIIRLFRLR